MNHSRSRGPIEVLMVEDNPDDVFLTQEVLKETRLCINLSVAENGEEAMAFLCRKGTYRDAPRPDLILLDLNMPRKDGREVLAGIKADDDLKTIPVVILTTSQTKEDIYTAYALHANCYVTKPVDLDRFIRALRAIEDFWLTTVELPRRDW